MVSKAELPVFKQKEQLVQGQPVLEPELPLQHLFLSALHLPKRTEIHFRLCLTVRSMACTTKQTAHLMVRVENSSPVPKQIYLLIMPPKPQDETVLLIAASRLETIASKEKNSMGNLGTMYLLLAMQTVIGTKPELL